MTQPPSREPLMFAPDESRTLALAAATEAGIELASLEDRRYEGGEFKLRPLQSVRDRTVFVLQALAETADAPIAQRLIRLLFLLQNLRDAGASRVIALIPYLAYARKDRRSKPRDPVYMRYIAELLEATATSRVVALDVHNAAAFDNAFRIPVDHLTALPMLAAHFTRQVGSGRCAVASPDIGGIKRAQSFRDLLERNLGRQVELLFVEKRREGGVLSGGAIIGEAAGRDIVVIDDLCSSGETLTRAASALLAAGASTVSVAVTHVPVAAGLDALAVAPEISRIVTTDSVGYPPRSDPTARYSDKLHVLSVGPLLGCAVARIVRGQPLAPMSEHWPLRQT